jgi:PAS domain S-box-containing protein
MAAGNLDREIEIHGKNEIGILAQSFANMRDAIREKIIALNKEIEERKQAQEAATKERHLLFALMDNTPDHIYFKDTRSRFTRLNKAMATWLGLQDPLQAVGKTDFNFFTKEHARQAYIDEQHVIKTGQPLVNVEEKETWPDNRQTWVSSTKIPLYDEGGSIVGTIGISRNITEQKHTQEALQKLNEELDQRVAERTAELQKLLETLRKTQAQLIQSEKMAALGELVSGIAHEINTPIGIGVTAASYLDSETHQMKTLYESDTLKQSDFNHYMKTATESTSMILKNLQRAAHLIQHFKQVSVDQITERRRVFNLKEYIEGVLLSLQPALRKKQHNVIVQCPKELKLKSYPGAFSQIITNFVMNSLSHGFEHVEKGEILITAIVMHGNMLRFEYSDNGCGIAPENLSKIFDPFFTTKRARGGTGLGMNVVYNLVTQRLRGNITCESEENKGTKFIIQMPIEEEE